MSEPIWRAAWRKYQEETLLDLDPGDAAAWPSRFDCFVAGYLAANGETPDHMNRSE